MTFNAHLWDGFGSFLLAAATPPDVPSSSGNGNVFDGFIVVMLIIGVVRGKMRGMSEELLGVLQWLLIVVLAALGYKLIGDWVFAFAKIPLLIGYVASYLFVVIVISGVFSTIKRKMGEKVFESDLFGSAEYPLGMLGGLVRYSCMIIALLAVANAFVMDYSKVKLDEEGWQKKDFGFVLIPCREGIHQAMLVNSKIGSIVKAKLVHQLILETPFEAQVSTNKIEEPLKEPGKAAEKAVSGK